MVKFDYDSILLRLINNLRKRFSWARILPNSVNIRLLETVAEEESELARYDEYLTRESKWDLARNRSSLFFHSTLLGYRPHRKKGATGTVEISTSPLAFSDKWLEYLSYVEEDMVRHNNAIWKAVVANSNSEPDQNNTDWERVRTNHTYNIGISKYTLLRGQSGLSFVTTEAKTLEASQDYTSIKVVQGEHRQSTFIATGDVFEEVIVENDAVENKFYEVFVNGVKWDEVDSLRTARGDDIVYQTLDSSDFSQVYFRFGDGVTGKKVNPGDSILINWVETDGVLGNITTQGSINEVLSSISDNRGNTVTLVSYNYDSVVGGKEVESTESIRRNGTLLFQAGDRLISAIDYKAYIEREFDFIGKVTVWGAYEQNLDSNRDPWEWIPAEENMVYVSGITPGADPIDIIKNPDGTSNESYKATMIKSMLPRKSPSDIVSFEEVEFINLIVTSAIRVVDENYLLPEVQEAVKDALIENYGIEALDFKEAIYESNYQRMIDQIDGVRYHTTEFSFYQKNQFAAGFQIDGILPMYEIAPNTLRFVAETLDGESEYLFAQDDGAGNLVAESGYSLSNSNIDYSTGSYTITVDTGFASNYQEYVVKVYYDSVSNDIRPKKRNQIVYLDTDQINITSEYYIN